MWVNVQFVQKGENTNPPPVVMELEENLIQMKKVILETWRDSKGRELPDPCSSLVFVGANGQPLSIVSQKVWSNCISLVGYGDLESSPAAYVVYDTTPIC